MSPIDQVHYFLQQQIAFLLERQVAITPELIKKLILSTLVHFDAHINAEDVRRVEEQLIQHLPSPTEKLTEGEYYHPPFAVKDQSVMNASEQVMTKAQKTLEHIRESLFEQYLDINLIASMTHPQIAAHLKPLVKQCLVDQKLYLNSVELQVLETLLLNDMVGFGPLEPLLADPSVTDILVNAPDKVYVERHGSLQPASTTFKNQHHILHIIHQILAKTGRRIDSTHPYVNVKLANGTRVNAIIPPIALDSPSISIRKFSEQPLYLENMVLHDNLSMEMMLFLMIAVHSRLNILISGGTGAGKTTLLNALAHTISDNERIITIEDVAELRLNKEHVVRLETRNVNLEGAGKVSEQDLLINALRMRPDRIILGEVRGKEAFDMLQAMNTGHDGSMSTLHANGTDEVPSRLIDMLTMANSGASSHSCLKQIKTAIDLIVHTARFMDGRRRVVQISELLDVVDNDLKLQHLFSFDYRLNEHNKISGTFTRHAVTPRCLKKTQHAGLDELVLALFKDEHED
jgi:pilus assembly protein CpaF